MTSERACWARERLKKKRHRDFSWKILSGTDEQG